MKDAKKLVEKIVKKTEQNEKRYEVDLKKQTDLRKLEQFYVDGKLNDISETIEQLKEEKVEQMIEFAKDHEMPIYNKDGDVVDYIVKCNPVVISNAFFKPVVPLGNRIPVYNAEKISILYDYYMDLVAEVNDRIGNFPPSLTGFAKFCSISLSTLRDYKNSADIDMRNIVEKIYDQIGDDNVTMGQMGMVKEKMTIFKLETQNEMMKKVQPNVNISYKEVINTDQINSKLEKYKSFLNKKGK